MELKFIGLAEVIKQEFSSAKTSIKQVAAGFKKIDWKPGTVNLDWGGGRFDLATEYLKQFGVTNYVYDPFNRSAGENAAALKSKPDTLTCFNVFNVIKEDQIILDILEQWKKFHLTSGSIYITAYEGDRSGEGRQTSAGFQRNAKTKDYLPLIQEVFPSASFKSGMIVI